MILGIDVSHWDGKIDWTLVPSDYRFAFIKATEGGIPQDAMFSANWLACKLPKAPYHFWRYAVDDRKQAELFFAASGKYDSLPPVADIEDPAAPKGASDMAYRIKGFLDNVESLFGRKPIIYTGAWWTSAWLGDFSAFAGYQFWLADYTFAPTGPRYFPRGCGKWLFHQYTDRGHVPGVTTMVDLNVFNGTEEDFAALAGYKPPLTLEAKVALLWNAHPELHP